MDVAYEVCWETRISPAEEWDYVSGGRTPSLDEARAYADKLRNDLRKSDKRRNIVVKKVTTEFTTTEEIVPDEDKYIVTHDIGDRFPYAALYGVCKGKVDADYTLANGRRNDRKNLRVWKLVED